METAFLKISTDSLLGFSGIFTIFGLTLFQNTLCNVSEVVCINDNPAATSVKSLLSNVTNCIGNKVQNIFEV